MCHSILLGKLCERSIAEAQRTGLAFYLMDRKYFITFSGNTLHSPLLHKGFLKAQFSVH